MAKIFHFKSSPMVENLTIPEIPDGGEGWLVAGPRGGNWERIHEGDAKSMSFPNAKDGIETYNLQSCTCIIYTAPSLGEGAYRGAWLYHGKGGYLKKGFPMPWELPFARDLRPADCLVAFSAWEDNDEWRGLIERLEGENIPGDNIVACLRPYRNFEMFAINTHGQVGEPFGRPPVSQQVSLEVDDSDRVGLVGSRQRSGSGGGGFFSCCRCYITTATCAALGLPDDNATLQALRWYRDKILMKIPEGRADVETYYAVAPAIVRAIESRSDRRDLYLWLYHRYLQPAVTSIRAGRYASAHATYREMVEQLSPLASGEAR